MLMAAWKFAALATGNSVILKPQEQSPLTAIRLAELASEAGIPDGVFAVLPGFADGGQGDGPAYGYRLSGLHRLGRGRQAVPALCRSVNMKRVYLECGGKSPNIILDDVPELRAAAERAATSVQSRWVCVFLAPDPGERIQDRVSGHRGRNRQVDPSRRSAGPQ